MMCVDVQCGCSFVLLELKCSSGVASRSFLSSDSKKNDDKNITQMDREKEEETS